MLEAELRGEPVRHHALERIERGRERVRTLRRVRQEALQARAQLRLCLRLGQQLLCRGPGAGRLGGGRVAAARGGVRAVLGCRTHVGVLLEVAQHSREEGRGRDRVRVSHKADVAPAARDCHVHPAVLREEANDALRVRAHQRDDDRLLLAPLEAVHRPDLERGPLARGRRHGALRCELLAKRLDLRVVRRDDADLTVPQPGSKQRADVLADHAGLGRVALRLRHERRGAWALGASAVRAAASLALVLLAVAGRGIDKHERRLASSNW
mmetsp:Transcript_37595/g.125777  ORF Transcript_37595/g.125777 Transcript_37595/m.125777 type:complete len:268 (+) Transcript_37595:169-972(+)